MLESPSSLRSTSQQMPQVHGSDADTCTTAEGISFASCAALIFPTTPLAKAAWRSASERARCALESASAAAASIALMVIAKVFFKGWSIL